MALLPILVLAVLSLPLIALSEWIVRWRPLEPQPTAYGNLSLMARLKKCTGRNRRSCRLILSVQPLLRQDDPLYIFPDVKLHSTGGASLTPYDRQRYSRW